MAKQREYAYYEKGNKLCIVEKAEVIQDGLNYTYSDGDGLDIPSGSGYWKSPTATITNGLRIEFAKIDITSLTNEASSIPLSEYLSKAVVSYMKAKIAEDTGEMELKEYHMREFYRRIERMDDTKIVGPRMLVPGVNWKQ